MHFLDPGKINILRGQIVHRILVAIMVVVLGKLNDRLIKFSWRVEVLQPDDVIY